MYTDQLGHMYVNRSNGSQVNRLMVIQINSSEVNKGIVSQINRLAASKMKYYLCIIS